MTRTALIAALVPVLAFGDAVDGGVSAPGRRADFGAPLYDQCLADAGAATRQADGSWLLPPTRAARNACLMETCDVRRQDLEAAPPPLGSTSLVFAAIAFGVGLLIGGVAAGYVVWVVRPLLP